jgi:hypothetical protein
LELSGDIELPCQEQYGGQESWFNGVILQVNANKDGSVTYNEYEDGDFEDGVVSHHIRPY